MLQGNNDNNFLFKSRSMKFKLGNFGDYVFYEEHERGFMDIEIYFTNWFKNIVQKFIVFVVSIRLTILLSSEFFTLYCHLQWKTISKSFCLHTFLSNFPANIRLKVTQMIWRFFQAAVDQSKWKWIKIVSTSGIIFTVTFIAKYCWCCWK